MYVCVCPIVRHDVRTPFRSLYELVMMICYPKKSDRGTLWDERFLDLSVELLRASLMLISYFYKTTINECLLVGNRAAFIIYQSLMLQSIESNHD